MKLINLILAISGIVLTAVACGGSGGKESKMETTTSGTIHISVDESFKPVIDSEIQVFESLHPEANVIVHYKPEADCLKDLETDSIRMVIVTRGLSEEERGALEKKLSYSPRYGPVAFDAIAVVVNNKSNDTALTMQDVRSVAAGTSGFKYKMLLDGTSATSTVRFVIDTLLRGKPLGNNVVAAKSSQGVIDYVSANNDAIGLIGVSWVGNQNDPQTLSFLEKVKIAAIECRDCNGVYVKPYQANIAMGRYPMVRPLYYILKENYDGLGSGFSNFLIYEKGQLIFRRAYLLPGRMALDVREMEITQ